MSCCKKSQSSIRIVKSCCVGQGAQGPQGPQGPSQGPQGAQGPQGVGAQGPQGPIGPQGTSEAVTLASVGPGETLVNDGVGPNLEVRSLVAATGIVIVGFGTTVAIGNDSPATSVTLVSAGGATSLVNDGAGPDLATKGLTGTANQVNVADGGTLVTLSTPQDIAPTSDVTFASVTLETTGGTPTPLDYYEELTVDTNATGPWGSAQPISLRYVRVGKLVTVHWSNVPSVISTTADVISVTAQIPAQFRPPLPGVAPFYVPYVSFAGAFVDVDAVNAKFSTADGINIEFTRETLDPFPSGVAVGLFAGGVTWTTA